MTDGVPRLDRSLKIGGVALMAVVVVAGWIPELPHK
jgi:hypothetical protein